MWCARTPNDGQETKSVSGADSLDTHQRDVDFQWGGNRIYARLETTLSRKELDYTRVFFTGPAGCELK